MMTNEWMEKAEAWMLEHGYSRWPDQTWNYEGHETDHAAVLAEYMKWAAGQAVAPSFLATDNKP